MLDTRVLVIEDDELAAGAIMHALRPCGFTVDWVDDAQEGISRVMARDYDLVTLDRILPGIDGLTILNRIRSAGVKTPVLMVSALTDVDERVRGLRAGSDDYLTKPFNPDELAVRVENLLRRHGGSTAEAVTRLQVGPLTLDLIARKAHRDGEEIALLPTEYRVLEFMMRYANRTITRSMLFEAVWGHHFDPGTNLIDVHVGRLRKKIEPSGTTPMIKTVRGAGYVFGRDHALN
ncbi:MAG: response regulator transcription factor [Paraburkholderia sp.]|jgi:two-component system OmpR family response regulator|uniref:response regulator transcription factor n=1 Tax=Burkholderiaceae TaxID=119060 RepID=UPI0010F44EE4|nr:response regulator transcription factor [Burkholderia sp. 4M9327F10]